MQLYVLWQTDGWGGYHVRGVFPARRGAEAAARRLRREVGRRAIFEVQVIGLGEVLPIDGTGPEHERVAA